MVSNVRRNSLNRRVQYEVRKNVCFKLLCTVKTKKEDFPDSLISTVQDQTLRLRRNASQTHVSRPRPFLNFCRRRAESRAVAAVGVSPVRLIGNAIEVWRGE